MVIHGEVADWVPVTDGASQGSVLGPVLSKSYVSDIDIELNNFIAKFSDSTKTVNLVLSKEDSQSLKDDLCKISAWQHGLIYGRCPLTFIYARFCKWELNVGSSITK